MGLIRNAWDSGVALVQIVAYNAGLRDHPDRDRDGREFSPPKTKISELPGEAGRLLYAGSLLALSSVFSRFSPASRRDDRETNYDEQWGAGPCTTQRQQEYYIDRFYGAVDVVNRQVAEHGGFVQEPGDDPYALLKVEAFETDGPKNHSLVYAAAEEFAMADYLESEQAKPAPAYLDVVFDNDSVSFTAHKPGVAPQSHGQFMSISYDHPHFEKAICGHLLGWAKNHLAIVRQPDLTRWEVGALCALAPSDPQPRTPIGHSQGIKMI